MPGHGRRGAGRAVDTADAPGTPTSARPDAFADPDTFDISRDAQHHLTFSHGLHNCLGRSLARAELQIALPTLFRRLPQLRLTAPAEVNAHEGRAVHGVRDLPVTW